MQKKLIKAAMLNDKIRPQFLAQRDIFTRSKFYFPELNIFAIPLTTQQVLTRMLQGYNIVREGYRGCAKTTFTRQFVINRICCQQVRYTARFSANKSDAAKNTLAIANMLIAEGKPRFVADYGQLYLTEERQKGKLKKQKTIDSFITENKCYVQAFALGTSARGQNIYLGEDIGAVRPELYVFDDVDTLKTTKNPAMIEKHYTFITEEVFGGSTADQSQIIVLGNTIRDDGVLPRLHDKVKDDPTRKYVKQAIYNKNGDIDWGRFVETDAEAKVLNKGIVAKSHKYSSLEAERRRLGSGFDSNYLLIPMREGDRIIDPAWIRYEYAPSISQKDRKIISVDPAESIKELSDPIGICAMHEKKADKKIYIDEVTELKGADKDWKTIGQTLSKMYTEHKADYILIENKAGGIALQRYLQDKPRNLPCKMYSKVNDKATSLRKTQPMVQEGNIVFNKHKMADLKNQMSKFPAYSKDDQMDAYANGCDHLMKKKKPSKPSGSISRGSSGLAGGSYF